MVYESILDWDAFSIRIRQFSIEDVPAILGAVTEDQVGGAECVLPAIPRAAVMEEQVRLKVGEWRGKAGEH